MRLDKKRSDRQMHAPYTYTETKFSRVVVVVVVAVVVVGVVVVSAVVVCSSRSSRW